MTAASASAAAVGYPWARFAALLLPCAGAALAVLLATFAVALRKGVHRVVDAAWGLAFTAVAWTAFGLTAAQSPSGALPRRLLLTLLVTAWGVRLSAHIARRGRGHGEDPRYERMLAKAPGSRNAYALRKVYLLQAALVWLVSLPVQAALPLRGGLDAWAWAGTAVWLLGFSFETIGDHQLARFRSDPANKGRLMDQGLWSWTRHPNYFGDFAVWWGLYLFTCHSWQPAAATLISPVVMTLLLTVGSGAALMDRHLAETRPDYPAYAARTSPFLPRPPRPPRR